MNITHCDCGKMLGKMKHTINEKIPGDGGFYIIRRRVCKSCWIDHMERAE